MAAAARPFEVGQAPRLRGQVAGEGPPIVLCHGLTASREGVLHGSRVLERAGFTVITYDARGHGESDPAPPGQGYGYPRLVADLGEVVEATVGERPFLLGGSSMGAHTAIAYALERPRPIAGLVAIGPAYDGEEISADSLAYWNGLADALAADGIDGFVAYIDHEQRADSRWRDSILRFTRERMEAHRDLGAQVEALRQVSASRPFGGLEELEGLKMPALVVASGDEADPGHPYATAVSYSERMPGGRLVSEEPGQSPLAWQGGKLSRQIASFATESLSSSL